MHILRILIAKVVSISTSSPIVYSSNYEFVDTVFLSSPSALVPVLPDNIISLLLVPSSAPPLCPIGQVSLFTDKSREAAYTRKSARTCNEYAAGTKSTRQYQVAAAQYRVRPLLSSSWEPPKKPLSAPSINASHALADADLQFLDGRNEDSFTANKSQAPQQQQSQNQQNEFPVSAWPNEIKDISPTSSSSDMGNKKTSKPTKPMKADPGHNPLHGSSSQYKGNPSSSSHPGAAFDQFASGGGASDSDALNVAVDVAKDVAGAVKKGFMSFASFGLKAVGEVVASAQGTLQANIAQSIQVRILLLFL